MIARSASSSDGLILVQAPLPATPQNPTNSDTLPEPMRRLLLLLAALASLLALLPPTFAQGSPIAP